MQWSMYHLLAMRWFFLDYFLLFSSGSIGERLSYTKLKTEKSQKKVFKLLADCIQLFLVEEIHCNMRIINK